MRIHKNAMTMWPALRHVQARSLKAQAPCSTPTPTISATAETMTNYHGRVMRLAADMETQSQSIATYITARQTIGSTDKVYRTSNTTVVVIFVVICILSIILSLCYLRRRLKDKKELARITGEEELARQTPGLPIRPTVHFSTSNNVGGLSARALYGDQIFRHELDGSEIVKTERNGNGGGSGSVNQIDNETNNGICGGGGIGSPDSDNEEEKAPTVYTGAIL